MVSIAVTFSHALGDIDIELVDAGLNPLADSMTITDNENIEFPIPVTGVYFLKVFGFENDRNLYDMDIMVQDPPSDSELCFPVLAKNMKIAIICL